MAEERGCAFCDEPGKWQMKVEQNCKEIEKVKGELDAFDGELHGTKDNPGLNTQIALIHKDVKLIGKLVMGMVATILLYVLKEILKKGILS